MLTVAHVILVAAAVVAVNTSIYRTLERFAVVEHETTVADQAGVDAVVTVNPEFEGPIIGFDSDMHAVLKRGDIAENDQLEVLVHNLRAGVPGASL